MVYINERIHKIKFIIKFKINYIYIFIIIFKKYINFDDFFNILFFNKSKDIIYKYYFWILEKKKYIYI